MPIIGSRQSPRHRQKEGTKMPRNSSERKRRENNPRSEDTAILNLRHLREKDIERYGHRYGAFRSVSLTDAQRRQCRALLSKNDNELMRNSYDMTPVRVGVRFSPNINVVICYERNKITAYLFDGNNNVMTKHSTLRNIHQSFHFDYRGEQLDVAVYPGQNRNRRFTSYRDSDINDIFNTSRTNG